MMIALGIGLHNLGEGLAIGAAYSVGAATLGTFLVVGFILQNITEGLGIVTPDRQRQAVAEVARTAGDCSVAHLPSSARGPADCSLRRHSRSCFWRSAQAQFFRWPTRLRDSCSGRRP